MPLTGARLYWPVDVPGVAVKLKAVAPEPFASRYGAYRSGDFGSPSGGSVSHHLTFMMGT